MTKSEHAYKSISEVARILELINKKNGKLNTHTIRFWEKQFKQVKPRILAGRRRYYDNRSIEVLKKIKFLLKEKGLTINGAKKVIDDNGSFKLDGLKNKSISSDIKIKNKLQNISNLIKELKKIKQYGKKNPR